MAKPMKLVIVESPAKCNTIKRYLGDDYVVMASLGHIRDLATSGKGGLGVDVDNKFKASYVISKNKAHVVRELVALKKKCSEVILATDPDREGEAIAWHLANVLNLDINTTKRLEFHEITRESITHAIENPRTIDINLVNSQEARRILDRIIGFKLSTLINRKIKSRSAGRVQSAALKLICDHDEEIKNFVPTEYWNILSNIQLGDKSYKLTFIGPDGKKIEINSKEDADNILRNVGNDVKVLDVSKSFRTKDSKDPFTTSTMQQEAFARLKYKTKKTQFVAQELYEGINVGEDHVGLITYMRTDSSRLSPSFIEKCSAYIVETFGKEYLAGAKKSRINELAQDAHEAIRPTSTHRTPDSVKKYLTPDQYNLYKLIYNRAIASMMKPKKEEVLSVSFGSNNYIFKLELAHTVFAGYEVLLKDLDEEEEYIGAFPSFNIGDSFKIVDKKAEQKFTQAPAHYTEAKMVKLMEDVGIGRPSTYASTIELLANRSYVDNNKGTLISTERGILTSKVLNKYFPEFVDVKYTAKMESKLDSIQDGTVSRDEILKDFYDSFMEQYLRGSEKIYEEEQKPADGVCPKCGAKLVYKDGKNGKFIGCSNYPTCDYVQKEPKKQAEETGEMCPICGKPLVKRTDRKGKPFIACSGFPSCKYIKPETGPSSSEEESYGICPDCGGKLIKKKGKYGYFLGCENYPKCNYMQKFKFKKGK